MDSVCLLILLLLFFVDRTEILRENKRMLDRSIREIERERQGLQNQEKRLIMEIKKTAKQGQMVCVLCLPACLPVYVDISASIRTNEK